MTSKLFVRRGTDPEWDNLSSQAGDRKRQCCTMHEEKTDATDAKPETTWLGQQ